MSEQTNSPKSYRTVEVEQQCVYGMTLDNVANFVKWTCIKDYAYIQHDEDFKPDGTPKEPHIHCMIRFRNATPTTAILKELEKCGIQAQEQQLQKMYKWESAIAYLTHANKPEKHQYTDDKVMSNFDWQDDRKKELDRLATRRDSQRMIQIISDIDNNVIHEYDLHRYVTALEYNTYKQAIDNAFTYRSKKIMEQTTVQQGKQVKVIWLYGPAGTGKTSYARYLCDNLHLDYYISESGKDPLGSYLGQPALILDDVRPEVFEPDTLLKMLDPHNRSGVKSRYRNKWLEVQIIIVTCNLSPEDWWKVYQGTVGYKTAGDWKQLTRRINCGAYDFGTLTTRIYNPDGTTMGSLVFTIPDELKAILNKQPETLQDVANALNSLLGGMKLNVVKPEEAEDIENLHDGFEQVTLADIEALGELADTDKSSEGAGPAAIGAPNAGTPHPEPQDLALNRKPAEA